MTNVLVALCTFNPNEELLRKVLQSVNQSFGEKRVLLIDSASTTSVAENLAKEFSISYIKLNKPGISLARYEALKQQKEMELLIFVDDDNVLCPGYLDVALQTAVANPSWGAFGGKLIQPEDYKIKSWMIPLLPYLAIKDLGDSPLSDSATLHWSKLEPPTAGAVIRPEVSALLRNKVENGDQSFFSVGAIGKRQLRGEDSYLVRQCFYLDLKWGYEPRLSLEHRYNQNRLSLKYLIRLLYWMGYSDVFLDKGLEISPLYPYPRSWAEVAIRTFYSAKSSKSGIVLSARHFGQFRGYLHASKT